MSRPVRYSRKEKEMIHISFTGAQSTGKSTLLEKCKDELSNDFGGRVWEFIPEVTRLVKRQYGVNINEIGNDDTQLLILNQHLINSLNPNDCIFDRCIIDGLAYTTYLYNKNKVSLSVVDHAEYMLSKLLPRLDLVFYTSPEDIPIEDDGERSTDKSFRDEVIREFEDIFDYIAEQYGSVPEVIRLTGSVEERMETIKKSIEKFSYESSIR